MACGGTMNVMLEAAIDCLDRGWSIFPVAQNKKIPLTGHGFKDATNNREVIKKWWDRYPFANIGVATGLISGIAVIDIDVKNEAKGKESIKIIKGLTSETFTVTTPSGGWHLYYSIKKPVRSRNGFLPGIDVKSDGGYVVGPGSLIDGNKYQCTDDDNVAELSWVLSNQINAASGRSLTEIKTLSVPRNNSPLSVSAGNWHFPVLREVARLVRRGLTDFEILSIMENYTLSGWGVEETRREVGYMIAGARRKGFDR